MTESFRTAPIFTEGTASAKVIADSRFRKSRLISIEVQFPRPYLAEFNTHRIFSRNSASSRAIPVWKRLIMALERPYIPASFGKNRAGMQAGETLNMKDQERAVANWLAGRDVAVIQSYGLAGGRGEILHAAKAHPDAIALCNRIEYCLMPEYRDVSLRFSMLDEALHKQHANRPLELYSFHTVIVTSSGWGNFLGLRASTNAQPEAQDFGIAIGRAIMNSDPTDLVPGEWHLPYVDEDDRKEESDIDKLVRISCGRCARTSYLTHEGIRSREEDLRLTDGLQKNGHMSPLEHPGTPNKRNNPKLCGNFSHYWIQYRKTQESEGDFRRRLSKEDMLLGCRNDEALANFILTYEYE